MYHTSRIRKFLIKQYYMYICSIYILTILYTRYSFYMSQACKLGKSTASTVSAARRAEVF
jgi:hypothetical protein